MTNCVQCGKPAIVLVGNNPLCVDCNLKLQQAINMQNERLVQEMNYLTDMIETTVGIYGALPRYKVTQPVIHKGDLTFHNINVSKSIVGSINTGNVQSIDVAMSHIKTSGNEELAKVLGEFTQAVINDTAINTELKNQIIEQLSFLISQYELSKEKRKPSVIKTVLSTIKNTVSTVASLVMIWSKLQSLLEKVLF
jgi:hypothetical protein